MDVMYQLIAKTLTENKTEFTNRGISAVRQCDIYMGQPDDPESFELFLPAVFVDWNIVPGNVGEQDLLQLDLHILQEPGTNSESFSNRISESMAYLTRVKTVKYLVNKLRTETSTPLTYAGERPRVTGFFKYHIASYKCYFDNDHDSFSRSTNSEATLTDLNITDKTIPQKTASIEADPMIDTYN